MKFDEYIKMKNFSEQQNFAVQVPGFLKNAGTSAWNYLKKVPSKLKDKAEGIISPGNKLIAEGENEMNAAKLVASGFGKLAKTNKGPANLAQLTESAAKKSMLGFGKNFGAQADLAKAIEIGVPAAGVSTAILKHMHSDKALKGAEGVFQKIGGKFTKGKGFLGSTRAAQQAELGKKIAAGAAGGTALAGGTVYALAGSGNMNPGKYYIFDDQTGKVLGSSSGYASKAEAMADRNARFQGGRINLGSTLAAKMSA